MKRFLAFLLAGVMLLALVACGGESQNGTTANPENNQESVSNVLEQIQEQGKENATAEMKDYALAGENDFTYEETETGVKLTSYTGTETFVEIPAKIGDMPVTSIGDACFQGHPLVAVKLPDSVEELGFNVFSYVTTLVKVELGSGLRFMQDGVFEGCSALSEIELPNGLETIGRRAFAMTAIKEINLPETLTFLSSGVFVMAGSLETVTVPGSVGVLNRQVFSTCTSLREVYIGEGITAIEYGAFESCSSLEKVHIPASCTEISNAAFVSTEGFVLYGPAGSAAEAYAQQFDYSFEAE